MLFASIGMVCRVVGEGNGGQMVLAQMHTLYCENIANQILSALFMLRPPGVVFGLTLRKAWLRLGVLHWLHMRVELGVKSDSGLTSLFLSMVHSRHVLLTLLYR